MEDKIKFLDCYSQEEVHKLPKYIQEIIEDVYVTGKQRKSLILPNGERYYIGNKLNDLTGKKWTYFTNSVINTAYSTTGKDNCGFKFRKIHPSPKPPSLLKEIIEFFTKENELVLDYYSGVGGTLLACSMSNRQCIGIELNPIYVEAYKNASNSMGYEPQKCFIGNNEDIFHTKEFMSCFETKKAKLILIDPPYFNMMAKEKTGEEIKKYGTNGTPFTNSIFDIGNMCEEDFWDSLIRTISYSLNFLENNGHIVVFIKDMQPKGKSNNLLHAKMIEKLTAIDSIYYLGLKIWADQTAKLFPYGYPFEFVATQIHQYILIFKKHEK